MSGRASSEQQASPVLEFESNLLFQRLPLRLLDLLQLGTLAWQHAYERNEKRYLADQPECRATRAWAVKHMENPDLAVEAVRLVATFQVPSLLRALLPSAQGSPCPLARVLGLVIGRLGSGWSDRLLRPLLWFAVVQVLIAMDRKSGKVPASLLHAETRKAILEGYRCGGSQAGAEASSESPRKSLGRALHATAMWEKSSAATSLLTPTRAARAWALPDETRERFRVALELETEPVNQTRFDEMLSGLHSAAPPVAGQQAGHGPSTDDTCIEPAGRLADASRPEERVPTRRSTAEPSTLPIPTLDELRDDIRWVEARIARAGYRLLVALLPIPGVPIVCGCPSPKPRKGEYLEGCPRCQHFTRSPPLRSLLLAWGWFRATAMDLPLALREFILSTHPSEHRLGAP